MSLHCKLLSIVDSNQSCTDANNSLQNHYEFWRKLEVFEDILRLFQISHNIPFAVNPLRVYMKIKKSALQNFSFVTESLEGLIKSGCVIQVPFRPFNVSPLRVAKTEKEEFDFRFQYVKWFSETRQNKVRGSHTGFCFCIKFKADMNS